MNFSKVFFGLTTCLLAASLSGCVVESSSPPPPRDGSITVDVTINNTHDPNLCAALGVDSIEVNILDSAGVAATASTICEDFGLTIAGLPEGNYDVEVLLLDAGGHQVGDAGTSANADVIGGTDLKVSIDFETVP